MENNSGLSLREKKDAGLKKIQTKTRLTVLDHIEQILNVSKDAENMEDIQKKAKKNVSAVSQKLKITPIQAVLFSHMVGMANDTQINSNDLQKSLNCTTIQTIKYFKDVEVLKSKGLISKGTDDEKISYRVPYSVVDFLRRNKTIKVHKIKNLNIYNFFTEFEKIFSKKFSSEIGLKQFIVELKRLIDNNMQLTVCKVYKSYRLRDDDLALLSLFCVYHVWGYEFIETSAISGLFKESRFYAINSELKSQSNLLFKKGLIEYVSNDGFSNSSRFTLTQKAKEEILNEMNININNAKLKHGLTLSKEISKKKMYYSAKEEKKISELSSLLHPNNFNSVQKRLKHKGMRNGFACLFYGKPGTGKTETANQIARITGRDIMLVDISETKSKWVGESEKHIKRVFDKYREYVKVNDPAPILLFNEADGVLGKRTKVTVRGDQYENAFQNIILQEMENLDGIMIATTNLTNNLDPAFERRFLYKIEFNTPTLEARKAIWKSQLPELCDKDAEFLASSYDFSGGQIENIARKRTVDSIIHGGKINLETIREYCDDEKLNNNEPNHDKQIAIGF